MKLIKEPLVQHAGSEGRRPKSVRPPYASILRKTTTLPVNAPNRSRTVPAYFIHVSAKSTPTEVENC